MKEVLVQKRILDNKKHWQTIFDSSPGSSVFQSPDWAWRMECCLDSCTAKPFLFEFADGTQLVWSMLQRPIKRMFRCLEAMPLGLYGKPAIYGEWSPEKGEKILRTILAGRCLEMQYVENPFSEPLSFLLPNGCVQEVHPAETHVLDLAKSWDVMWEKRFSTRIRNQVRRAEKEGLKVRPGLSKKDVDKFYLLYEASTKTWGYNQPPYSKKFFQGLMDNAPDILQLLLVEDHERTVAGGIFIEDTEFILYWFGAMDKTAAKKFPTYLLLSHAIREAINKGKRYMNMGASGELDGVRQFKELWGARPVSYNIFVFKRHQLIKQIDRGVKILRIIRGT
jgi:hypothetical protein